MPIGQSVHPVLCDPPLRVEEGQRYLIQALSINMVTLRSQDIHAMAGGLLRNESLPILLMPDVLLHNVPFHAFGLLNVFPISLKDAVHLGTQPDILDNGAAGTLIRHLPQHLLVCSAVQRMLAWVVRRVIELSALGHIPVDVLTLDLEEEAVGVGVEELSPLSVLALHLVVVEVIHEGLRQIEDAHAHVYGAIEDQTTLVDLNGGEVVAEDVCSGEGGAGDETAEFVLLV